MKILVTGGAGFIGSHFVRLLLAEHPEDRVVCLDALTYAGSLENLAEAAESPRFRFVRGDIADRGAVYGLFEEERPDAVVNFAAESHVDRSIAAPSAFLRTNILGTAVLMDACVRAGGVRFHQVSTDEVYGELAEGAAPWREDAPLHGSSPYAASKASAELLALAYHRTYGLPVTISRGSNTYGPHQFPEKLIPLMICRALSEEPLPVYGDGGNVRDWLYVEDHCCAIDAIFRRGRAGEAYNVGGQHEMRNIDVVRRICAALGKSESLIHYAADRKGHDRRYALDIGKISSELGWRPETRFEEGFARTVRWYVMRAKASGKG